MKSKARAFCGPRCRAGSDKLTPLSEEVPYAVSLKLWWDVGEDRVMTCGILDQAVSRIALSSEDLSTEELMRSNCGIREDP